MLEMVAEINRIKRDIERLSVWESGAGGGVTSVAGGLGITVSGSGAVTVARSAGTSFPGSPATGDLFYRTDRNIQYSYNGTRWLSDPMSISFPSRGAQPFAGGATWDNTIPYMEYNGYLIEKIRVSINCLSAQSGTNYLTFTLNTINTSSGATNSATLSGTTDTKLFTVGGVWKALAMTTTYVANTNETEIYVTATGSGAPGNFYASVSMGYRLIG